MFSPSCGGGRCYLIRESTSPAGLLGGASGSPTAWPAGEIPCVLISCASDPGWEGGGSLLALERPKKAMATPIIIPITVSTTVYVMRSELGDVARYMYVATPATNPSSRPSRTAKGPGEPVTTVAITLR